MEGHTKLTLMRPLRDIEAIARAPCESPGFGMDPSDNVKEPVAIRHTLG
jgi:hypothetical protein